MLLALDIGNTNIVVGLFKNSILKDHFRISTRHDMTDDELGFPITSWLSRMNIENEEIDSVAICSVVPPLTKAAETASRKYLGCLPLTVTAVTELPPPITIEIDRPEQVGADRICNAVAGFSKFGGPIIIVDFGTATTFDIVNDKGAYIGGVIIPGPETSMKELAHKAAQLFEVQFEKPERVIGKSTQQALQSGLFYGTLGQIDYLIDKISEEAKFEKPKVIATGGLSSGVEKHSRHISKAEPTLTLEGLRIIAEAD